jgi:HSP20 family protein
MPDVSVKRSESATAAGKQQESQQTRRDSEVARRGESYLPSPWSISPSEFFSLSPFTVMRRLSEEMDRAFSGIWSRPGSMDVASSTWAPAVDVTERDGKLVVSADLPGLHKDEVKVEVTDENLIIHGERKREEEERREGFHRTERRYGSFYRVIPLPQGANADQARAQFKDGVLEVSIPVPQEQRRSRQIQIEEGKKS